MMNNTEYLFLLLLGINIVAYIFMWVDKIKSVYKWWRISEKTLWTLAVFGGVFGVWFGMQAPLYHKAGKRNFRIGIPVIGVFWMSIFLFYFIK